MKKILKNYAVAIVIGLLCFCVLLATGFASKVFAYKPEDRILLALDRTIENTRGIDATYKIKSSKDNQGDSESETMLWIVLNSVSTEGKLRFNSGQNVIAVDGEFALSLDESRPYSLYADFSEENREKLQESFEKLDIEKIRKVLSTAEKSREKKRIAVGQLLLPEFVDAYSVVVSKENIETIFGEITYIDEVAEALDVGEVALKFYVDKNNFCRGICLEINKDDVNISAEVLAERLYTNSAPEEIDLTDSRSIAEITLLDFLDGFR
jgi:hypothetical protein